MQNAGCERYSLTRCQDCEFCPPPFVSPGDSDAALIDASRARCVRNSASMLQKRAPCSTASSSATCVCGSSSNQCFGRRGLIAFRYGKSVNANASVLISSADHENGQRSAKRIMYQNI